MEWWSNGVMERSNLSRSKTFLKKPFAFSQDTGKNIGVGCIFQCQSVVF